MLTREENERLTRVGRGTPMGELTRRFWLPFLLTSDVSRAGWLARLMAFSLSRHQRPHRANRPRLRAPLRRPLFRTQ